MLKFGQTTGPAVPQDSGPNFIVMDAGQLVWGLTQINKKERRRESREKVSGSTHMADVMAEHTHVLCLSRICHSPTKADNQNEPFAAQSGLLGSLYVCLYVCVWLVCKFVRGPRKLTTMETNLAHGDMKLKLEKLFNNSVYRFQFAISRFPVFPFLFYSIQFPVFVLFLFWFLFCALWFKNRSKMSTGPTNLFGPFRLLTFSEVSGKEVVKGRP